MDFQQRLKMKLLYIILCLSFSAFADYKSEVAAIEKFEVEVFQNKNNYLKAQPGQLPDLTPAFRKRLQSDEKSLKYFYVLTTCYRAMRLYQTNSQFALFIKKQFGGKEPNNQQWERVFTVLADSVLSESTSELKKCLNDNAYSDEHFDKNIQKLLKSKI